MGQLICARFNGRSHRQAALKRHGGADAYPAIGLAALECLFDVLHAENGQLKQGRMLYSGRTSEQN